MDFVTPGGIVIAVVCIVTAFLMEGGALTALISPSAMLIVFGGTIGATTVAFSFKEIATIPQLFKQVVFKKLPDFGQMIDALVDLADKARREGLLYLDNHMGEVDDPFLRKAMQLVIDGTDPEMVRNILETEIYATHERHSVGVNIFEAAGGYAPTMGIIGTVMGLVTVLGNLSSPDELGPHIAMAFIATLYGISSANIFWLPLGGKLKNLSKKELMLREMMVEGVLALQAGYNPMIIRERLNAFLKPDMAKKEVEEDE